MTLILNLPPDVEACLLAEAEERGLPVEEVIVPLVLGFVWPANVELAQAWHRQEADRGASILKLFVRQRNLRERVVDAVTRENFLKWQVDAEERAIVRYERETALAVQEDDRQTALKAFQRRTLHQQKLCELRLQFAQATENAGRLRQEVLVCSEVVHRGMAELLRMKIHRRRAEVKLGLSAAERVMADEEAAQIRKYASEQEWNGMYEKWLAANDDTVPNEPLSDIEVMEQINAQTEQAIEKHLQRLAQIDQAYNSGMSSSNSEINERS